MEKEKVINYLVSLSSKERNEILNAVQELDYEKSRRSYEQNRKYYLNKKEKNRERGKKMKELVNPGMFVRCEGTKDRIGVREVLEINSLGIVARKISRRVDWQKSSNDPNKYYWIRDEYITTHSWDKIYEIIQKPLNFINNN